MSCAKEPWLIKRFLNDQLNETKVRNTEAPHGLHSVAESVYGNIISWNFLKENYASIIEKL